MSVRNGQALVRTVDTGLHIVDVETLKRRTLSKGTVFEPSRIAATNETVAIAKILPSSQPFASLINSVLHRLIEQRELLTLPEDPAERLSIEKSFPLWLTNKLIEVYGFEETKLFLEYHHDHAFMTVRRNALRVGKEEF
jgi:16S rRNA C967 or C1407 C5-methylase (RsmB/RsmF family)